MINRLFLSFLFIFLVPFSTSLGQMVSSYQGELGKTVAYDIASFTDVRDKTLRDVLNKMPGVSASSALTYNGMMVSKIFVNGIDLRSSFTTVAGIKPEEVDRVEFVENFQSVKVLQNRQYSSIAAVNIILKESAGSDWSGTARAGLGGTPLIGDGDLYALRIGLKSQSMVNLKVNNTGQNLSESISAFSIDNIGLDVQYFNMSDYIAMTPSSSPLSQSRTRLNESYLINTVNTFKLSEKFQFYTQMSFYHDENESGNTKETTNFLSDGSTIYEVKEESAEVNNNQFKTNLALISNTPDYYFVNHLLIRADQEKTNIGLTGTYPNIQNGEQGSVSIRNDMRFLKPIGDWNLIVYSQNQIANNPQDISVNRESTNQVQKISSSSYYSDTKMSFGYTAGRWTISLVGAFDAMQRPLNTTLTGLTDFETIDNSSVFGYINSVIQPKANFISNRLQLQLGFPVNFYHYWFEDELQNDRSTKNNSNFEPSFSLKYEVSQFLSLTFNGEIQYDRVDASSFYTGMILTNYREIEQGSLKYDLDGERSISASFSYKLPQNSFFLSGNTGYQMGKSMYKSFDTFIGDYVVAGSILHPTDTRYYYGNISANKGITSLKGTIGLTIGYTNREQSRIRNDEEILYNTQVITFSPNINGRLAKWCKVEYSFSKSNTLMQLSNSDTKTNSNKYNQSLEFVVTPLDKLNFSISGEHYHTIISGDLAKNLVLTDVKAEYQVTPNWQLIASITNLLDQEDYSYTVIGNLSTSHYSYIIRPRNFLVSVYYKF